MGLIKQRGVRCVLATNPEKYETRYLLEKMSFNTIFNKVYSSAVIGHKKPSQNFYQFVFDDLKKEIKDLKKNEIFCWDDRK